MIISFVVPTVNRGAELRQLLQSFVLQSQKPDEIIIIEQGKNTKDDLLAEYPSLTIKYFSVDFQSLTKARNFGISKSSGDVVGFLDDDIVLSNDYVEKILDFFSKYPQAIGVQGVITNFEVGHAKKVGGNQFVYKMYNLVAKFFLLNNSSRTNKLLLSGRNQYASRPGGVINCEWLSGIGNYRKQIFATHHFDENLLGYALGEDKLFSYPIFREDSKSLFIDPDIKCEHNHAYSGRPKDKEWVDMKINYTDYLWKKLLKDNGLFSKLAYWWANLGDLKVVFWSVLLRKNSFKFFVWHLQGYYHILWKKR